LDSVAGKVEDSTAKTEWRRLNGNDSIFASVRHVGAIAALSDKRAVGLMKDKFVG
jgi:hypothetical protein